MNKKYTKYFSLNRNVANFRVILVTISARGDFQILIAAGHETRNYRWWYRENEIRHSQFRQYFLMLRGLSNCVNKRQKKKKIYRTGDPTDNVRAVRQLKELSPHLYVHKTPEKYSSCLIFTFDYEHTKIFNYFEFQTSSSAISSRIFTEPPNFFNQFWN